MFQQRPIIAITIGDPSGIGPEVTVKALCLPTGEEDLRAICKPLLVGDLKIISDSLSRFCPSEISGNFTIRQVYDPSECRGDFGVLEVFDVPIFHSTADFVFGKPQKVCGKAAMEYIRISADLALKGKVQAICNAPINKEATVLAGFAGLGHLEYLTKLTHSTETATMLTSGNLRVVHLSTHIPLKKACDLTFEQIVNKLQLTNRMLLHWGGFGTKPLIAVAGLNPHNGEGGLFGKEEIEVITPAVEYARSNKGINVIGPIPADSVFVRAMKGEFAAVIALYHDQGHIAIKVHGFEKSVSVALGLPFIRTSVDHGTAFDIAGKGIATFVGMIEAIKVAANLASKKPLVTPRL